MTRLHNHWGAPEAEIFVFKFLPWPGFEPRTSQSNGRERNHSTTATSPNLGVFHASYEYIINHNFDAFLSQTSSTHADSFLFIISVRFEIEG